MARKFRARDPYTITDLTAATYRYGGGQPGRGVQLTLRRDEPAPFNDEPYQVVRLPAPMALGLAAWIRAMCTPRNDVDADVDSQLTFGLHYGGAGCDDTGEPY